MFDYLHAVLVELENAQGTKAKEAVLNEYIGHGAMRPSPVIWMLKAALDQGKSYGIDKIPPRIKVDVDPYVDQGLIDSQLMATVEKLGEGRGVTDEALGALVALMSTSEARYVVMSRILRKDLRCGVKAKTVNKIAPGLVFRVPYQRCSGFDRIDKMTWPALLQRKANGLFLYKAPGARGFITRNGMSVSIPGSPITKDHIASSIGDKFLVGEVVVYNEDMTEPLPRAVSNGIVNAFLAGGGEPEYIPRMRMYVWATLSQEEFDKHRSDWSYNEMFTKLRRVLGEPASTCSPMFGGPPIGCPETFISRHIRPIEYWYVDDLNEASTIFKKLIAKGEEGCVVKSLSKKFIWKDQSACDYQIKMKAQAEAEFIITGIYPGESGKKYEGKLGGVSIKSKDGLIMCDCGGGHYLTDAIRNIPMYELEKTWVGKIGTFKFFGITENQDKPEVFALDHPQFEDFRGDEKTEADTFEYCQNALKGGPKE